LVHEMGKVIFRSLTKAHIKLVTESVENERWGYERRDIERCWQYQPKGCFIAEFDNKPIGHVFSISYGKMGWIGLLIVKEEHRQKGVGALLMQTAMDYLQKIGVETIRLEAVEKAVPLYKRLGFNEEFDSLRFNKLLKQREILALIGEKVTIQRMREKDLANLARFDSKYFGANRPRVLQSLYKDSPGTCFLAKEKQDLVGYIMSRKVSAIHRIGPWVCAKQNPRAACDLLVACINAIEEKETELRIGMPAPNADGTKLMEKLSFQLVGKSIRMVWGKHKHKGDIVGIFGIAGPEKG